MSLIYGRNIYKVGALGLFSTFSILQAIRYFDIIDNGIMYSITKHNWLQFDELMKYRDSNHTIIRIIDRFLDEIKCEEINEQECVMAMKSAEKLLLYSTDSNSKSRAITLLISLASSVGKLPHISDKVLSKIEDVRIFNNVLEVLSNYLVKSNSKEVKYQVIKLMYKILDNTSYDYIPKDDSSGIVLNNTVSYLLECEKLGLLNNRLEKAMDSINNTLDSCLDEVCLVKGISLLISVNKTDKISDEIISKIKSSKNFDSIINCAKDHLNNDKNSPEIKNSTIRFIVRISEKFTGKSIDKAIKVLLSLGKADEISDVLLSKFKDVEKLRKLLENTSDYIKESQHLMSSDSFHSFKKENSLIMNIVSSCGDKCIGYAMEQFSSQITGCNINLTKYEKEILKRDAYQNIKILADQSMLAKMITDSISVSQFKEGSQKSLEDICFYNMLLDVEKERGDLHKNQSCVQNKKEYFHKIFYGDLEVFEESTYYLKEDIASCYYEVEKVPEEL